MAVADLPADPEVSYRLMSACPAIYLPYVSLCESFFLLLTFYLPRTANSARAITRILNG